MDDKIKDFIENNIKLIELDEWKEIYEKAKIDLSYKTGEFTEVMLAADIHPEKYFKELPAVFLLGSSNISNFNIPNKITSIGEAAFRSCIGLTNVIIPDSVISIGDYAFSGCISFTRIEIPDNVISIGERAFEDCTSLKRIIIGNSVTSINMATFYNCTSLTNIIIKNPGITFEDFVFEHCNHLDIQFAGTKNQWRNIAKGKFSGVTYICTCIDGVIKKSR